MGVVTWRYARWDSSLVKAERGGSAAVQRMG